MFRAAEFAEGLDGYAFRNEWLFWVFETLPMIGAIGIFIFYHPAKYLGRNGGVDSSGRRRWPRRSRGTEKPHGAENASRETDRRWKAQGAEDVSSGSDRRLEQV